MSHDSLRLGLEAGGGVLPGPSDLTPPTSSKGVNLLQTPVCEMRSPGTPKSSLELMPISTNSNGGVPTLTTPTLTPTTLRNIEQMFAESDPHDPPHHYEHAAGFAPPIISPTSGNSYVPLGQVTLGQATLGQVTLTQVAPLNCHRPSALLGPPDIAPISSATKPSRPTNLSLSRPPPLLETTSRHRPTCLLPPQQQAADLSLPSPTRNDLSISLVKTHVNNAVAEQRSPSSLPLAGANLSQKLDMMDKLLKAVAATSPLAPPIQAPSQDSKVISFPEESGKKVGGRRRTDEEGIGPEEEGKRAIRRERNKQAAARCRKRRMDLTSTLQGEVDQWEEKVRGLKEELLQLEAQKKGLEAVLRRHQGPCKINRQEN